jgi:hypothetical protein
VVVSGVQKLRPRARVLAEMQKRRSGG